MYLDINKIHLMNCVAGLKLLKPKSVNTSVSSPPYYALRDYDLEPTAFPAMEYRLFGQRIKVKAQKICLGLEKTPQDFIGHIIYIYRLVREALTDDGTLWVNIGDSYAATGKSRTKEQAARKSNLKGSMDGQIACSNQPQKIFANLGIKPKDMLGIPWMLAFALREDGWFLRQDIIWAKKNCMPESVGDRCTKNHEYIFLLSKSRKYYFDSTAILEPLAASTQGDSRLKNGTYTDTRPFTGAIGGHNSFGSGMMKPKMPGGWANSEYFKNDTALVDGRQPRPGIDTRGGNQGKGTIPKTRKITGAESFAPWKHEPDEVLFRTEYVEDPEVQEIPKSQNFKRDKSHHLEPIPGQNAVQHRPDRKDTVPTGMRNKRSVWSVATEGFSEAHFATFPQKLIEDCIKGGASEYGCCPICGKGYVRTVETKLVPGAKASYNSQVDKRDQDSDGNDAGSNRMKDGHKPGWHNEVIGEKWIPGCKHQMTHVKKSVVLDMFMGSGTTAIVSAKLGRDYVGFEQSEKYLKIAERRLRKELGMFNPIPKTA